MRRSNSWVKRCERIPGKDFSNRKPPHGQSISICGWSHVYPRLLWPCLRIFHPSIRKTSRLAEDLSPTRKICMLLFLIFCNFVLEIITGFTEFHWEDDWIKLSSESIKTFSHNLGFHHIFNDCLCIHASFCFTENNENRFSAKLSNLIPAWSWTIFARSSN